MTHSRLLRIIFTLSILILIGFESFGQFENDWFNSSQVYFSFKIGQNGVYRLNHMV